MTLQQAMEHETETRRTHTGKCSIPTLCPDDLIRPCIKHIRHDGFCDAGVR